MKLQYEATKGSMNNQYSSLIQLSDRQLISKLNSYQKSYYEYYPLLQDYGRGFLKCQLSWYGYGCQAYDGCNGYGWMDTI